MPTKPIYTLAKLVNNKVSDQVTNIGNNLIKYLDKLST